MTNQLLKYGFIVLFFFISTSAFAQKKALTPDDYAQWQRIGTSAFSADGNWFAYNLDLVEGDGWLNLTDTKGNNDTTKFMHATRPTFAKNSKWLGFLIGVSDKEEKKLTDSKKSVQYNLGLLNLSTSEADTIKMIQSFDFSEKGDFLAMKKYKAEGVESAGSDIILRDLNAGTNQLIGNVSDFSFNDAGTHLALTIDASEKVGNGVHLINLATRSTIVLDSDSESYKGLTWHEKLNALAFMKSSSDTTHEGETNLVFAFSDASKISTKKVFDHTELSSFPEHFKVVDFEGLEWSKDAQTLFFGIKEWEMKEKDEPKDSSAVAELDKDLDPTNVEIWHWQDAEIQPQQEVRMNQNKQANYLSAWHWNSNSFVQLEDHLNEDIDLTGDHKHALIYDYAPYEPAFREDWSDLYVINNTSGKRTKILERIEYADPSPGGKYIQYFLDDNWWTYDIAANKHTNITAGINARFENFKAIFGSENFPPFGTGQWAENDEWVLVYDEHSTYKVWPNGQKYELIADGSEDQITYRQTRLNYEDNFIPKNDPIYLSKYGATTKDRGYARVDSRNRLQNLVYESRMINRLEKAERANRFVMMRQGADESPNYFFTSNFDSETQLTDTNPQQDEYFWADDEVISFTNDRGEVLEGRLLYPANYQEGKQYPMMTYIYELRSQSTHSYSLPSRTSPYNMRRFSSEGYFVFEPDITYELRDPGVSAVQSVVPAVQTVLETGMVDPEKVGLTGHSWGAYQTSFIITQTDMFNSAVAGAPLTNMISMYSSIYWNSGTTDAQIFEVSQGRFPDPYWMDWDKYIENSPVFNMQNTTTPLLVEFGTEDGAVDFNQGVELYTTMRRMEKPYVMLVYEGENHGLRRRENMIDYATRAFEWHDYFLMGNEPASWILEGLPYLERPEMKKKK